MICPLPKDSPTSDRVPETVSVVARLKAAPTNRILVQNRPETRTKDKELLAVCVKPLHYDYDRVSSKDTCWEFTWPVDCHANFIYFRLADAIQRNTLHQKIKLLQIIVLYLATSSNNVIEIVLIVENLLARGIYFNHSERFSNVNQL